MSIDFSGATVAGIPYDATASLNRGSFGSPLGLSRTAFSIGGWFNRQSTGFEGFGGTGQMALNVFSGGDACAIQVDPTTQNIQFNVFGTITTTSSSLSTTAGYHYLCLSFDATNATLFYDGVQVGQISNPLATDVAKYVIGSNADDGGLHVATFCGLMSYVRVYTRALTASNWAAEMVAQTPASTTNLYANYRLLDSSTAATDSGGSSHDLTVVGAIVTQSSEPTFPSGATPNAVFFGGGL